MQLLPMWHKHNVLTYWPVPGCWCQRTDQRSFANALCCRLWTRRSDRVPAIERGQDQCKTYCDSMKTSNMYGIWPLTVGGDVCVCLGLWVLLLVFFFCLVKKKFTTKSWTVEGVYIVCDLLSQQVVDVFVWTSVWVKSPLPPPTWRRPRPKYWDILTHIDSFLHMCVFLSLSVYI